MKYRAMGRAIIKLTDPKTKKTYYLEWSSIVDAPVTYGLSLNQFREYYKDEYGRQGMEELPRHLERVEKTGTSTRTCSLQDILDQNRAGENEKRITKEQIIERYCRNRIG